MTVYIQGVSAVPGGGLAIFGDGSDGDVTIAANTTLTRDMFYNNLTVNATFTLNTAGYRVFVKGTLTNNGTIRRTPNAGAAGVGGAALAAGSLGGSFAGANKVQTGAGAGGGGGGPVFIAAKTIVNAGVIAAIGGAGENAPGGATVSGVGGIGTNATTSLGGAGGLGGASTGAGGGAGGTVTGPVAGAGGFRSLPLVVELRAISTTPTVILVTGGGGGGSGGTYDGDGSAGGGGGGGGGFLVLIYNSYSGAGTKVAPGGAGGTSVGGGAAGATGSSGTVIEISNA